MRLDEVAEVRLGRQRSPKNHIGTQMRPYLRAANVDWNGLKLDDVKQMNFTDGEAEIYRLRQGDIVLSEASGSPGEVGKPALWSGEIEDCCIQNTLLRVRSYGPDPRFLLHLLRHEAIRGAFVEPSRGVGIHHIGAARLSSWPLLLPPLAEQRRIVAAVEGYLSKIEEADACLDSALAKLASHRQATATTAVRGSLVSNDSAAVSANHLVEKIAGQGGILSEGDWAVPASWVWSTLGDLFEIFVGFTPSRSDSTLWQGDVPWVSSGEVAFGRIQGTREKIALQAIGNTATRLHPPGTLLLAMIGEGKTRGQVAILDIEAAHNQNCASIRVSKTPILPEYVYIFLMARYDQTRRAAAGGNQLALNRGMIREIRIPVPPVEEQVRIVEVAHEAFSANDRLVLELGRAVKRSAGLVSSLLAEAFAGRLVPQDPDDEPAAELLARIRAERAATIPKQRTRSRRTPRELAAPPTRVTGDDYQQETLPL
ncbi:restriction endonuclease subunit S [Micromonospora sp. NPDC049257]|uniref:restriction endonuclease subunit S n=1 Tax=Micromonospora sp. NPDC049257 TaxID=3155771 RepID=UPI00343BDA63